MKNKFKSFADALFTKHGIRKGRKGKDAFLDYCKTAFNELGYDSTEITVREDRNLLGRISKNFIVGPQDADILVTAHYDTPPRNGFLLFTAPVFGALGGSIFSLLLLGAFIGINAGLSLIPHWIAPVVFVVTFLISYLVVKNPHNHNDNTSGVIGVFKVAELAAENPELRKRCAFVLFDHEEVLPGLLGSRAFAEWRKENFPDKAQGKVINLDVIGVGKVLTVVASKESEAFHKMAEFLEGEGHKPKKLCGAHHALNSDHAAFPNSVSLGYANHSLLGPVYVPKVHTNRDRHCDLERIEVLCGAVYKAVATWAQELNDKPKIQIGEDM